MSEALTLNFEYVLLATVTSAAMDSHLSLHLAQKTHIGDLSNSYLFGIHAQPGCALLQENSYPLFREPSGIFRTHELQHLTISVTSNFRMELESLRRDLPCFVGPLSNK